MPFQNSPKSYSMARSFTYTNALKVKCIILNFLTLPCPCHYETDPLPKALLWSLPELITPLLPLGTQCRLSHPGQMQCVNNNTAYIQEVT